MEFFPAEAAPLPMVLGNWVATLAASSWLIATYFLQRQCFLKPSMMILACYHVIVQFPFVFLSGFAAQFLPTPWEAFILIHGFILGGLAISQLTWNNKVRLIWGKLASDDSSTDDRQASIALATVAVGGLLLAGLYLLYVPASQTGLYALLTCPELAVEARESSLKLLSSPVPVYALTILSNTVAPLLTALVVLAWSRGGPMTWPWKCFWFIVMLIVWVLAFLNGAKAIVAFLAFVGFATVGWKQLLRLRLTTITLGVACMALPIFAVYMVFAMAGTNACVMPETPDMPAMVDLAAGQPEPHLPPPELGKEIGNQLDQLVQRSAVLPTAVGLWYVDYAQREGTIGLAGIPSLARLSGVEPVVLSSVVGLAYGPRYYGHEVLGSISATTGFLFTFYAYFGLGVGLVATVACLALCDLLIAVLYFLPTRWLIPQLALWSLAAIKFTQSDFLTVWLTHGFGLGTAVIVGVIIVQTILTRYMPTTNRKTSSEL